LAIVAMVLSFVNVIVGSCIVQAADKCLWEVMTVDGTVDR
jgi:hypothetical protein